jgi:hypothetical protein
MCDYSLHAVASRPAKVGDTLSSTKFANSLTRGFAAVGEPNVAVCLLPGTEIAFEKPVEYDRGWLFLRSAKSVGNTARFRRINEGAPNAHHDALEFADGQIVLVHSLKEGQRATVLQMPAQPRIVAALKERAPFAV